ncbi:hypothetical protein BGZ82_003560 [Podila clonocystis]|nr:hypothetical protein BGZ82_003560 [Podila clonocystis]
MSLPQNKRKDLPKSGGTGGAGDLKPTRRRRRPNESYSIIIVKAIQSSPYQRLKLSEIYNYVSKEIPHMGNDKGWQNTVRHNLSHMKCFRRIMAKEALLMGPLTTTTTTTTTKDESTDPSTEVAKPKGISKAIKKGKGGYWILVPEHLEETSTQIRPKKSSVDHSGSSSSSATLLRGMDVDKDVASMEIASMAIADNPPYRSQSYPPGHQSTRSNQRYASHARPSQEQQQHISPEPNRTQEDIGGRPMATQHSSRLSESSRGSEEDELEEDDDEEYEDEEYDDEEDDDEDDRSTSSKDSRLGAGMSIHHLLN